MDFHPDFSLPWCQALLSSPTTTKIEDSFNAPLRHDSTDKMNSMFKHTLNSPTAIRAQLTFRRPTQEAKAITSWEYCSLLSLGTGLDGKQGRAHGGFNSLVLDQMTGFTAAQVGDSFAPATATMTVDYKAPVETPGVVFSRAWAVEKTGRKTWVEATIEDGKGNVMAKARALFIDPKQEGKL